MKARVKATGEIVEVRGIYTPTIRTFGMEEIESYDMEAVEIITDTDYWTRLEHQYAGMAMQGILSNGEYLRSLMHTKHDDFRADEVVPSIAVRLSHTLVEKMKEERK